MRSTRLVLTLLKKLATDNTVLLEVIILVELLVEVLEVVDGLEVKINNVVKDIMEELVMIMPIVVVQDKEVALEQVDFGEEWQPVDYLATCLETVEGTEGKTQLKLSFW
jgi:hypothetical protein